MAEEPLTYSVAGVDIESAQRSLRSVQSDIAASHGPQVLGGVGGFGGLFDARFEGFDRPVLVSSIDGVGTKTKVAQMVDDYSGLGADIVNHCINDILCQGARPLFFMDYFGCSRLEGNAFTQVVSGAARACQAAGCALIGGETAEMPGVYLDGEIDIVGSIVGVVDYEKRLPRGVVKAGDELIGLASDGLHTNGFSLARKALFDVGHCSARDVMEDGPGTTIAEELLRPHRCYANAVLTVLDEFPGISAVAHITGGGLYDNLPRVLPPNIQATIDRRTWTPLPIFKLIQACGGIEDAEMFRVFNMGIGLVLVVDRDISAGVVQRLQQLGEHAAVIGATRVGASDVQIV